MRLVGWIIADIPYWLLALVWIGLCEVELPWKGPHEGVSHVHVFARAIEAFVAAQGALPEHARHLAVWAHKARQPLELRDRAGLRLDYHPLNKTHWLVRSFSEAPRFETSWQGASDVQGLAWPDDHPYWVSTVPGRLGLLAPSGNALAQLFHDSERGKSQLIVLPMHKDIAPALAFHDRIEEFLWLQDGRLIFTGVGSTHYADGLYLWDPWHGHVQNLTLKLLGAAPTLLGSGEVKGWIFKLAAYEPASGCVAFWAYPRAVHAQEPLEFFAPSQLKTLSLEGKAGGGLCRQRFEGLLAAQLDIEGLVSGGKLIVPFGWLPGDWLPGGASTGQPLQQQWGKLPVRGGIEEVIVPWQALAEAAMGTPMFVDVLWQLAFYYNEALGIWRQRPVSPGRSGRSHPGQWDQGERLLRAYGLEITSTLLDHPLLAGWQRVTAQALWDRLSSDGAALDFAKARLRE